MDPIIYLNHYKKNTSSISFNDLLPYIREFNENVPNYTFFEEYNVFKESFDSIVCTYSQLTNHDYISENRNHYLRIHIENRQFTISYM